MTDLSPYRPCVGVMLMNTHGQLFVGQRIDNPGSAWQMPQGGIDDGESPKQAALRELEEETGVSANHVSIISQTHDWLTYDLPTELAGTLWGGRYVGQKQLWFLMRFSGQDSHINIATAHPEFSHWQWVAANNIIDLIVPFKRKLYQQLLQEFAPHLEAST